MSSFAAKAYKKAYTSLIEPALSKSGMKTPATPAGDHTMGALVRFLLINAASVIGAKLINEAAEYASRRMQQAKAQPIDAAEAASLKKSKKKDKALETKHCPKCGAFVIKGESCDCA